MVDLRIPCGIKQGDPRTRRRQFQKGLNCRIAVQLSLVLLPEFGESFLRVGKPGPQRRRWRNFLESKFQVCLVLGHPARPETVHKNPEAVVVSGFIVDAFEDENALMASHDRMLRQGAALGHETIDAWLNQRRVKTPPPPPPSTFPTSRPLKAWRPR